MKELLKTILKIGGDWRFWVVIAAIIIGVMIYQWAPEFNLVPSKMTVDIH